jgi:hypothetical protein
MNLEENRKEFSITCWVKEDATVLPKGVNIPTSQGIVVVKQTGDVPGGVWYHIF